MVLELSPRAQAVLAALETTRGRVVGRVELARCAGLSGLSPRRVDAILVELRRALGDTAIVTVRGRGWMVSPDVDVAPLLAPRRTT